MAVSGAPARRRWAALTAAAAAAAATAAAGGCAAAGSAPAAAAAHSAPAHSAPAAAAARTVPAASPAAGRARLRYTYLTDLSDGAVARRYGYALVDLGPSRAAVDALPRGERALVWIGNFSGRTCQFTRTDADVRQALGGLAGDPRVAGYYIADEPDDTLPGYGGHCPDVAAQVAGRSRLVHRLAPGAFTYEVITEPGNFRAFASATDIMGADPYPCLRGHPCDWSMIPAYAAALRAAHVRHYWGVLQAFGYRQWRFPTPAELTRMIRQWQRSGWQGEQTFAWAYAGRSLVARPGLLAVLRQLNTGALPAR